MYTDVKLGRKSLEEYCRLLNEQKMTACVFGLYREIYLKKKKKVIP